MNTNVFIKSLLTTALLVALFGCSGTPHTGSSSAPSGFTIGGTVTGLTGTGLVLQDNGGNNLPVTLNGVFTFTTGVASGGAYAVTVLTQPTNPTQTCTVTGGSGTATANVTSVVVTCVTGSTPGTATIGGTVVSLTGTGLVLQDNGGDNLTISASGGFTFATALATGSTYNVTVLTQPTNPAQSCVVANGSGTANANIGNIVVTCSAATLSVGGSVSGLDGTGLVLQDNGGSNLTVTANGTFTFATLIASGGAYNVTVLTQPTNPAQTCTVTGGSGTTTSSVTSVQVLCPAVFNTIGGQIVGLYVPTGQNADGVLQDNGGDNLPFSGNGPFTFATPIAYNSAYDVTIFVSPQTQPQGARTYFYQGTATADVTSVVIDFGHNDWTWMGGDNTANQFGSYSAPTFPITSVVTNTPGGARYPATWTDLNGNLWLFSGYGYSTDTTVPQPAFFQEMWNYTSTADYGGSYNDFWTLTTPASSVPAGRWGAVTWTDATGNLWLFGGQDGGTNFLNDTWSYDISTQTWTYASGGANQSGVYGTKGVAAAGNIPGGRWGATGRLDASGNLWLFGGYGYDSTGALGLLNDLWEFSGGQWAWVSGSNLANPSGVYGTQGSISRAISGSSAAITFRRAASRRPSTISGSSARGNGRGSPARTR
jgi:hypothetical protein